MNSKTHTVMEHFKGTKGKWEATPLNDGSDLHAIFSAKNNTLIARTCYMPFSKANAQLIAHAPETLKKLAECKVMFSKGKRLTTTDMAMMVDEITDLLTRATTI